MSLLSLELSDAGIMAAAKDPLRLLQTDGTHMESPAFALPEKKQLLLGRQAEEKAHLQPLLINNRFWDQLNTEALKQRNKFAQSHAEIACAHLARIWDRIKEHGDDVLIAVPGFLSQYQLGLVRSIADELSIPLRGLVTIPIAAAQEPRRDHLLVHVDIHLHRTEMAVLDQDERLSLMDTLAVPGKGLHYLYKEVVEAIAEEFVRLTRFDPLHEATSEQELYNRLPHILSALRQKGSVRFEITTDMKSYRVKLSTVFFIQRCEALFAEVRRVIADMRGRYGNQGQPLTLQLTSRVHRLPGYREMLAGLADAQIVELKPGAGAFGAMHLWEQISPEDPWHTVTFLTSRPWQTPMPRSTRWHRVPQHIEKGVKRPTHLLYRHVAYPISGQAVVVGRGDAADEEVHVRIQGELSGVSKKHCSIRLQGDEVVLTDHSNDATFVDGVRVSGTTVLNLGQIIRVGTPGEKLQLIACLEAHET